MKTTTKTFDAVAESRKWKESIAAETANLSREETLKYFDGQAVNKRFQEALQRALKSASSK